VSAALQTRAEIVKLARVLGVEPGELDALAGCAPATLRKLRCDVSDRLVDADRKHFAGVARASKVLPTAVAAKLAEHALGPLLAARVAALMDVDRARELARRLSPSFLADIAVEMDVRHASELIVGLPAKTIVKSATELDRRGEHVAMSMFVGHLSDEALAGVLEILSTESLLAVGFLIEAPERLDEIVGMLTDDQVTDLIVFAAEEDRWSELLGIADFLGPEQLTRVTALAEAAGATDPLAA
jgi:hypothetical protein